MQCDTRTRLFNFRNFRCRKRSKKDFFSFDYWELKKFYFYLFPEADVVLLTCYQRSFIGQSFRENFVPMPNALDRSHRDRKYHISI